MAIDIAKFFNDLNSGVSWAAGVSFQRSNPLPLDKYSVFESYDKALEYATTKAVAYPGQVISVLENGKMALYIVNSIALGENTIMSLAKVGGAELDGNSLALTSAGLAQLTGFEEAENNKFPMKVNGSIVWKSLEEVGINSDEALAGLRDIVNEHKKQITEIEAKVEINENKLAGITTTVIDAINAAIPGNAGKFPGLVITNDIENGIKFVEGKGEVTKLNVNKLVQSKNTYLVLNGGSSINLNQFEEEEN